MSLILLGILNSQVTGGGAGAYDLLETQILTSSASSVTFTGLDSYSDYKHLQIRAALRGNLASDSSEHIAMRFNGDTASNYASHRLVANGSTVTSAANTSYSRMRIGTTAFTTGDIFGAIIIDILDFASSTKNTTSRALSGAVVGNTSAAKLGLNSGLWNNTAALTSVEIYVEGVDTTAGSRFSLYGVK